MISRILRRKHAGKILIVIFFKKKKKRKQKENVSKTQIKEIGENSLPTYKIAYLCLDEPLCRILLRGSAL